MLEISLKGGVEVKDGWIPFYEHRKRNGEGEFSSDESGRAKAYLRLVCYDKVPQIGGFKHQDSASDSSQDQKATVKVSRELVLDAPRENLAHAFLPGFSGNPDSPWLTEVYVYSWPPPPCHLLLLSSSQDWPLDMEITQNLG